MAETTEPLRYELQIAAPPELVFGYFTDPARMVSWMGVSALLDPQPGGVFRVDANGRDVISGEYLELEPPRRVVFSWGFEGTERAVSAGSTRVEVTLESQDGGTLLVLSHHGLTPSAREAHAEGWTHYLARLTDAAAGQAPGPDPWVVTDR